MNYNSLFCNYAVSLNTLTRCNTCMEWNTLQDGYDKQDKEIVINYYFTNYYQLLTHVLFKSLIIITLLEIT